MSNLMKGRASLGHISALRPHHRPVMARKKNGCPLPDDLRCQAENLFGEDLSDVRLFVSNIAPSFGATAFASGSEIHFAPGAYDPQSAQGMRLLGQMLAHIVQQRQGRVRNTLGYGMQIVKDPQLEAEAQRMGRTLQMMQLMQQRTDTTSEHDVNIRPIKLWRWMRDLAPNLLLHDIVMPGSHDAGMYVSHDSGSWMTNLTITQFLSIREQLDVGTRFFDIRVYHDDKSSTFRIGHFWLKSTSTMKIGSYGPPLDEVLRDVRNFIQENNGEVVVLKFSLSNNARKHNVIAKIQDELGAFIYTQAKPVNVANLPLGTLRGRVVAVFESELKKELPKGWPLVSKEKLPFSLVWGKKETIDLAKQANAEADAKLQQMERPILWLNGDAPEQSTLADVVDDQNKQRKADTYRVYAPHLEMFYLTITVMGRHILDNTAAQFGLTYSARTDGDVLRAAGASWESEILAAKAYENAVKQVALGADKHRLEPGPRVNIYMIDFVNAGVNEMLIRLNPHLA